MKNTLRSVPPPRVPARRGSPFLYSSLVLIFTGIGFGIVGAVAYFTFRFLTGL